jgi:hypothetical protein
VRVGVSGTPLVVQQERVLIAGLKSRQWYTQLQLGALPSGVALQKTFYVFNTGGLGEALASWVWRCRRPSTCSKQEQSICTSEAHQRPWFCLGVYLLFRSIYGDQVRRAWRLSAGRRGQRDQERLDEL